MFSNVPVIYHFKSKNDDRKEREETPDNKKICQSKRGEKYKHEKTDDVITVDTSRVHRLITVASQNSFCVLQLALQKNLMRSFPKTKLLRPLQVLSQTIYQKST